MALKVRHRTRLRRKEVDAWFQRLSAEFGMAMPSDETPVDAAEAGELRLLIREEEAIAFVIEDSVAPTVRGLLAFPAQTRFVTVDMGAVPFVYNGADVMAPGIVDADPAIRSGDLVWVRDEKFRRPLAVGRAIMDGPTMAREKRGKAVETLHHVGDDLWRLGEEDA
ncbi:MAG TPA: RNA-binding protein [Thermoplasmata archaeon]|nr:RNA-binding protein [Thermoplasmata archaeon]